MNAERIHAIALAVKKDIERQGIVKLLTQLASHLQNVVSQPQQPNHQELVAKFRKDIEKQLRSASSNEFSPAWNQALQELNIDQLLGNNLADRIDSAFISNQVTPQVALQEIQELSTQMKELQTNLTQLIASFNHFQIGYEVLEEGESELGILIPREFLDNRFDKLTDEFKEINGILRTFSEISTGSIENFQIKSLSTTDPFIILGGSLATLSTIAIAIKPIIAVYKDILEIKILHAQLAEKNVAAEKLKGIEEHAEEIMGKTITKVKEEIIEKYPLDNEGRKNELENALGGALRKIANRIDRGFNIEIRVEPIAETEGEENEEGQEEEKQNIKLIQSAMKEMEFIKVDGEPILHLPETISE